MGKKEKVTVLSKKEYFSLDKLYRKKYRQKYENAMSDYTYEGQHDVDELISMDVFNPAPAIPQNRGVLREDPLTGKFRIFKSHNVYLRSAYCKLQYAFYKQYCKDNGLEIAKWPQFCKIISDVWNKLEDGDKEDIIKDKRNYINWGELLEENNSPKEKLEDNKNV